MKIESLVLLRYNGHRASGKRCYLPAVLCFLAEAQAQVGRPQEGLETLAEALILIEEGDR